MHRRKPRILRFPPHEILFSVHTSADNFDNLEDPLPLPPPKDFEARPATRFSDGISIQVVHYWIRGT